MQVTEIDISKFERSSDFYPDIDLILTVKSFDLQAIRKRYLESRKNVGGRVGSAHRREKSIGGIVEVRFGKGQLIQNNILTQTTEPRGLANEKDVFVFAGENQVHVFDGKNHKVIEHDWFSYIHTVDIAPGNLDKVLVASSGLDCIFEISRASEQIEWDWFAWDHGFDKGMNPESGKEFTITRHADIATSLRSEGKEVILIEHPSSTALPTAQRAAFINSVAYYPNEDSILATFFHEGAVYSIDRESKQTEQVMRGLKTPHGGRLSDSGMLATSTSEGHVVIETKLGQTRYVFGNLPGKEAELGENEWLQNSIELDGLIITIDSNRTSFVIIDPKNQCYDMIAYDKNWAVQDLIPGPIDPKIREQLINLK